MSTGAGEGAGEAAGVPLSTAGLAGEGLLLGLGKGVACKVTFDGPPQAASKAAAIKAMTSLVAENPRLIYTLCLIGSGRWNEDPCPLVFVAVVAIK